MVRGGLKKRKFELKKESCNERSYENLEKQLVTLKQSLIKLLNGLIKYRTRYKTRVSKLKQATRRKYKPLLRKGNSEMELTVPERFYWKPQKEGLKTINHLYCGLDDENEKDVVKLAVSKGSI